MKSINPSINSQQPFSMELSAQIDYMILITKCWLAVNVSLGTTPQHQTFYQLARYDNPTHVQEYGLDYTNKETN
jgi:hypothetical protein